MCLLLRVAIAKMCIWALEQPETSLMEFAPRVKAIFELPHGLLLGEYRRVQTFMGAFSAPTAKPTYIYSVGKWHQALIRALPKNMDITDTVVQVVSKTGKKGFTGCETN